VFGQIDLPHAARADFVENHIVAQRERFALVGVDVLHLKRGELMLADQLAGKLLGVFGCLLSRQSVHQRLHVRCGQQPAAGEPLQELFERKRHEELPFGIPSYRNRNCVATRELPIPSPSRDRGDLRCVKHRGNFDAAPGTFRRLRIRFV
jgi:hypothetical protein